MPKKELMSSAKIFLIGGQIPDYDKFQNLLLNNEFAPLIKTQSGPVYGFDVALHPDADELLYNQMGAFLCCVHFQEKKISAAHINAAYKDYEIEFAKKENRKPNPNEKETIKQSIKAKIAETYPPSDDRVLIWIDPTSRYLCIGAKGAKLEKSLELLRKSIPDMTVEPLLTDEHKNSAAMTSWLSDNSMPVNFSANESVESCFKSITIQGMTAKFKQEDLSSDEVQHVIQHNDKRAAILPLFWGDDLSFKLESSFQISGLKLINDMKLNETFTKDTKETNEHYAASFCLFTGVMREFIPQIIDALSD